MANSRFKQIASVISVALGISLGAANLLSSTIADFEGEVLTTYKDVVGIDTVCFGDTDPSMAIPGVTYTREECLQSLARQVISHTRPVLECLPGVEKSESSMAAFGSLSLNIGPERFCSSTAAKRFRSGDYAGACAAIPMWNKAGGKVVKGLVRRRAAERALCERGIADFGGVL